MADEHDPGVPAILTSGITKDWRVIQDRVTRDQRGLGLGSVGFLYREDAPTDVSPAWVAACSLSSQNGDVNGYRDGDVPAGKYSISGRHAHIYILQGMSGRVPKSGSIRA